MAKPEKITCPDCNGKRTCSDCGGRGKVKQLIDYAFGTWTTCSSCDGQKKCPRCTGKGFYWGTGSWW